MAVAGEWTRICRRLGKPNHNVPCRSQQCCKVPFTRHWKGSWENLFIAITYTFNLLSLMMIWILLDHVYLTRLLMLCSQSLFIQLSLPLGLFDLLVLKFLRWRHCYMLNAEKWWSDHQCRRIVKAASMDVISIVILCNCNVNTNVCWNVSIQWTLDW